MKKGQRTIRSLLVRIQMLNAAALILITAALFLTQQLIGFRNSARDQLESTAGFLARNLVTPLIFSDHDEAVRLMASLRVNDAIGTATLYSEPGNTVVSRISNIPSDEAAGGTAAVLTGINHCQEIIHDSAPVGRVCLQYNPRAATRAHRNIAIIFISIVVVGFLASYLLSLLGHMAMTRPIRMLIDVMARISRTGDYSSRVGSAVESKDSELAELSTLSESFDRMLEQIQHRDEELHGMKNHLEYLVEKRTQELQEERAGAEERSKMAALGVMAGGIAHEINNPLAIIHALAERQSRRPEKYLESPDALRRDAEKIVSTVDRIARIIQGLRMYARDGGSDPFETASVKDLVTATLDLCQNRFVHHEVKLTIDEIPADLRIECRSVQISQILLNLLVNAFDAVQPQPERWVRVGFEEKGERIRLSVTDSGPGIPEEIREKILQPFFTTKPVGKGTGLGLSVSSAIATGHGGRLFIDPDCPTTRFVIELPKVQKSQDQVEDQEQNEDSSHEATEGAA